MDNIRGNFHHMQPALSAGSASQSSSRELADVEFGALLSAIQDAGDKGFSDDDYKKHVTDIGRASPAQRLQIAAAARLQAATLLSLSGNETPGIRQLIGFARLCDPLPLLSAEAVSSSSLRERSVVAFLSNLPTLLQNGHCSSGDIAGLHNAVSNLPIDLLRTIARTFQASLADGVLADLLLTLDRQTVAALKELDQIVLAKAVPKSGAVASLVRFLKAIGQEPPSQDDMRKFCYDCHEHDDMGPLIQTGAVVIDLTQYQADCANEVVIQIINLETGAQVVLGDTDHAELNDAFAKSVEQYLASGAKAQELKVSLSNAAMVWMNAVMQAPLPPGLPFGQQELMGVLSDLSRFASQLPSRGQ